VATVRFAEQVILERELELVRRDQLVAVVRQIRNDPTCGKPLRGPLAGCRSKRIGGSENRIVYHHRVEEDEVIILAIGRRRDDAVYDTAARRPR
jgi:mRNA-degrading endonuclease RelE of RelBE toxin-antitoxin system